MGVRFLRLHAAQRPVGGDHLRRRVGGNVELFRPRLPGCGAGQTEQRSAHAPPPVRLRHIEQRQVSVLPTAAQPLPGQGGEAHNLPAGKGPEGRAAALHGAEHLRRHIPALLRPPVLDILHRAQLQRPAHPPPALPHMLAADKLIQ